MKDQKVILGSIMLLLTFILVYVNFSFTDSKFDEPQDNNTQLFSEFEPIKVDSDFLDLQLTGNDSLITIVAILNTKVCPSCVTNTVEFISEAKKRNEFSDSHKIIFIDEEEEQVDRFIEVTRLKHPVKKVKSNDIDLFFQNKSKVFVFLNSNSEVLHYFPIPVAHASIEAMNYEIDNVIELNKLTYNPKQNQ